MGDVCNVHAEQNAAVFQRSQRNRVIKILGAVAVDGKNQLAAQIAAALKCIRRDMIPKAFRLRGRFGGKPFYNAVFVQDGSNGRLHGAVFTKNLRDRRLRQHLALAVVHHAHGDAVARLRAVQMRFWQHDFRIFFACRLQNAGFAPAAHRAHDFLTAAFEHTNHLAFPAGGGRPGDVRPHARG